MAYNKKQLVELALKEIKAKKLVFIQDVTAFLPCSRSTFYSLELDKEDSIKDALEEMKVTIKASMRTRWYKSQSPVLQIALYKLLSSADELDILNSQRVDVELGKNAKQVFKIGDNTIEFT
jgi:hypothetical protein